MRARTALRWGGLAAIVVGSGLWLAQLALGDAGVGYTRSTTWTEDLREPAAVAVLPDGAVVVADYSADAVFAYEADGKRRWSVTEGLDHPSGLAGEARGVWVADTGHARLVLLEGASGRQLAEVRLPADVHPTDAAAGPDGSLWVSATPDDRLLLVGADGEVQLDLRAIGEEPLRAPRGMASDGAGGVYVAEALAGRVLHLDASGSLVAAVGGWGLGEGEFLKPKDVAFVDGTLLVVDSHQGVIQRLDADGSFRTLVVGPDAVQQFGHPLGVAAGAGGRLYVADAAAGAVVVLDGGAQALLGGRFPAAQALFRTTSVRGDDPDPLCRQCHDGTRRLTAGNWDPAAHNHPREIGDGAQVPADVARTSDGRLKCTSCHDVHLDADRDEAHGEIVDIGLAEPDRGSPVQRSGLCLTCHVDYLDTAPQGSRRSHPIGLPPPEGANIEGMLADGGRLDHGAVDCRTCHRPHGAVHEHLLVRASSDGTLCVSCHEDHDAQHSRHPVGVDVEPAQAEQIASFGGALSPDGTLTCLSCHDPHASTASTLLRVAGGGADACRACHAEDARPLLAGGHGKVGCPSCHGMHDPPRLPSGERAAGVGPQLCLDCHTSGRKGTPRVSLSASHPIGVGVTGQHGALPLSRGAIACDTCHAAHSDDDRLLRAEATGPLCLSCHTSYASVVGTDHDAAIVGVAGSQDTCVSCHDAHGTSAPYMLQAKSGVNPASGRCLRCHDGSTSATNPGNTTHPSGLLMTVAGLPFRYDGPVPYFGPDGEPSADREIGEITCMTCHDPHRWKHGADAHPGAVDGSEQDSFLRDPDAVAAFCSVCHGVDGLANFKFFHSDRFRKGRRSAP